ncbi:cellulase family glycosylhydrolase [Allostreptomyces psammosilenae]|uniref:Endo-1,4-beta-mannosidase n=1 Tax=Allostreptomyces psammosilenae TaxID=1892865 RepID=A0A852ZWV4_9ACTN|nr:cellulase family glycosylhydrolase [Allostreptomyces psammosilenae]NYI06846.1 endo-1,4-beta-mannosidase [Allostreptomyces psammosilenae]
MHRPLRTVRSGDEPVVWLGANFWSRGGGPLMWREENYDPALVREELRVLRDHGLTMTRSFFYWPDFHPEPDRIDSGCLARYADFLEAHTELGMSTIPTFIVGHMSGQNWDPSWRNGRDLYRDVWMVARQAWFVTETTRRFADHPAVTGWLISNEMPIYGEPAPREAVTSWATLMVQAVRAGGGRQPVSIGDGAWGVEVTGVDNGFSVRDIAGMVDFLGPHVYRMEDDLPRQHYGAAFICELAGTLGLPVVLEEFGLSTDFASAEHAAAYYRQVLHNTLLAGATGWIAWNNTDYDNLIHQAPYSHHPFELHFGLTTVDGTAKPHLRELARFAATLERIDVRGCVREDADAALVVPAYLEGVFSSTTEEDRRGPFTSLRQAYVTARLADLPVGLTRELDGLADDCRLYLVPSLKQLTAPTWYRLEELAGAGATVFVSYTHGAHGVQRGPWHSHLNSFFGVRHLLRYGLVNPIEDDEVTFTFRAELGGLRPGDTLRFRAAGTEHSRAYLPVEADGAEVVAVDGRGRPALLRRRVGDGWVVLSTYPLEHMAALTPGVNPEDTRRLYEALAEAAGVVRPVTVDDPHVSADTLRHRDGRRFAFLTSQSPEALAVRPRVAGGGGLVDPETGEPVDTVDLAPYDARLLLLPEAPRTDA